MKHAITDIRTAAARLSHTAVLKLTVCSHFAYYSLVAWEAHGAYRYVAAVLVVVMVVEHFVPHGPEVPA